MGVVQPQRGYRHSTKTTCGHCGSWPHRTGEECKASGQVCYNCGKLRHFSKVCRHNPDYQNNEKTAVKHIEAEEQPPDYFQSEYTTPYYVTNEQVKAPTNASRLQPEPTIFKVKKQNILDLYG